jgi:hypothetical protein
MDTLIMSGVVIGLVGLLLLVVVGAVIYFAMQEEKATEVVTPIVETTPVVTIAVDDDDEDEEDDDTFDIVNGWVYDNEYTYMIGVGTDGSSLTFEEFDQEKLNQAFKWTFEKDGKSIKMVNADGKYLKITSSEVQVTSSGSSSSVKFKLVPVDDGYKISNKSGSRWMEMDGANLKVVKEEAKASVFSIEPSQYYIRSYETDAKSRGTDFRESMSKHSVSCGSGVISSMEFKQVANGNKHRYDYKCTEGEATSGDLFSDVSNEAESLSKLEDISRDAFKVSCEDGALAKFRIVKGTGDTAYYKYACRDIGVSSEEDPSIVKGATEYVDLTYNPDQGPMDKIGDLGGLSCDDGMVLTGFEVLHNVENPNTYQLSGICKKLSI